MMTLAATLIVLAQAKTPPDLHLDAKLGVSIQKPPKKEEWEFRTSGLKISNATLSVVNKVESIAVEILVIEPPANAGRPLNQTDLKPSVEAEFEAQSKSPNFTEVKKKKLEEAALPGNAAGGAKSVYLEMAVKDKNGAEFEWRLWTFIAKESKYLVKINILTAPGEYEKNKKDLDQIISTLRTFKPQKK